MKKISLIVPVYNVELYVEKCIHSCIDQNLLPDEYEIIIVNDGTKDKSLEIVKRIAKEYSNIMIVSQTNAGLSAARNKGLSLAQGEYIWFIDSDDWIKPNCLVMVLEICKSNNLDILGFAASDINQTCAERRFNYPNRENKIYQGKDFLLEGIHAVCVPFSIYCRRFLLDNNLLFYKDIFHEDSEFTPRSFYLAKRVMYTNDILYFVFQNPNSITRVINPKKSYDLITVSKNLDCFSKTVERKYTIVYHNIIALNINNSLNNSYLMERKEFAMLNMAWKDNRYLFAHLLKSNRLKYQIEGVLFKYFCHKYIQIYQFIQRFNIKRH